MINAVAALVGLPLIQWFNGHRLGQLDWFGTSPDILILVTLAMLIPGAIGVWWLIVIPLLWALFTFAFSWALGYIFGMTVLPMALICVLLFAAHQLSNRLRNNV